MTALRLTVLAALAACATIALAEPPAGTTAAKAPAGAALPIESDWKARADAWFDTSDDAGRRKEMRAVTRALRQPCRYCHTPDFTGYTDKRLVSQQMMALSAEHGVECADCHAGKDALTPLGQKAAPMWALAREKKVFCGACHVKHQRFGALTERGKRFEEAEWPAWKAAHPTPAAAAPATDGKAPPK